MENSLGKINTEVPKPQDKISDSPELSQFTAEQQILVEQELPHVEFIAQRMLKNFPAQLKRRATIRPRAQTS